MRWNWIDPIEGFVSASAARIDQRLFDMKYVRGGPENRLPDEPQVDKTKTRNQGGEDLPGEREQPK
jgi:hypothetical protein